MVTVLGCDAPSNIVHLLPHPAPTTKPSVQFLLLPTSITQACNAYHLAHKARNTTPLNRLAMPISLHQAHNATLTCKGWQCLSHHIRHAMPLSLAKAGNAYPLIPASLLAMHFFCHQACNAYLWFSAGNACPIPLCSAMPASCHKVCRAFSNSSTLSSAKFSFKLCNALLCLYLAIAPLFVISRFDCFFFRHVTALHLPVYPSLSCIILVSLI